MTDESSREDVSEMGDVSRKISYSNKSLVNNNNPYAVY